MNDLFESIAEAKDERQAIQKADGIVTTQEELRRCESVAVVRRYFPKGDPKPFFAEVEKRRGKPAADVLREDCRREWARARAEVDTYRAHRAKVDMDKVTK